MSYASEEAKKQAAKGARYAMIEDSVVFGWAVHYFEEDDIEGTLYNEDGTEYKKQREATTEVPPGKVQPKPQPKPQMSLFDLMNETTEVATTPDKENPDDDEDDMLSDEEIREIMAEIAEEEKKASASDRQNVALAKTGREVCPLSDVNVDVETGEILTEEEMRVFDGDIEEPKDPDRELSAGIDVSAFDKTALAVLDAIFGNKIILR